MDLQNKTVVITGAARGLGAAMAKRLASHGGNLALVDLDAGSASDTAAACEAAGATAKTYGANVAKEDDVVGLFSQIAQDFGSVDGLINNAGITRDGLFIKFKDGGKLPEHLSGRYTNYDIAVKDINGYLAGK